MCPKLPISGKKNTLNCLKAVQKHTEDSIIIFLNLYIVYIKSNYKQN